MLGVPGGFRKRALLLGLCSRASVAVGGAHRLAWVRVQGQVLLWMPVWVQVDVSQQWMGRLPGEPPARPTSGFHLSELKLGPGLQTLPPCTLHELSLRAVSSEPTFERLHLLGGSVST